MRREKDILDEITEAEKQAARNANRALIIQPGAVGDCILTLPLAQKLRDCFNIGTVQMLGKSSYIDYFPGRTAVDGIRDMDSVDLYKLFVRHEEFDPEDGDLLIQAFADYQIIITFLGNGGSSDFEQNLIYAANCSNPVDVWSFPLHPEPDYTEHLTNFYIETLAYMAQIDCPGHDCKQSYIRPTAADVNSGKKLLEFFRIDTSGKLVVIQPGSGGMEKCWHIDNFYALAELLCEKGFKPLFLLGPAEVERFRKSTIDRLTVMAGVVSELTLAETFQLLSVADCFVGNDSGITHMAASAAIPTVACFGPTDSTIYSPLGPKTQVAKFTPAEFASPGPESVEVVCRKVEQFLTS